jgi:hypothetical protein
LPADELENDTLKVTPAKTGFTPRFKAGVTNTKTAEDTTKLPDPQETAAETTEENTEVQTEQPAPAKLGFKPRFKAGITTTKPAEEQVEPQKNDAAKEETATSVEPPANTPPTEPEQPTAKPAYKPRFTPNMIKRKPPEEE